MTQISTTPFDASVNLLLMLGGLLLVGAGVWLGFWLAKRSRSAKN
jgi:hypothetical protein